MYRVLGDKAVAPLVDGLAELGGSGGGLEVTPIGTEAKVGAAHRDRWVIGLVRRGDVAVAAFVGAVDPVIEIEPGVGNAGLRIDFGKSSIEDLAEVGGAITGSVLHIEDVGRGSDD